MCAEFFKGGEAEGESSHDRCKRHVRCVVARSWIII